jgi:hypothetical protein
MKNIFRILVISIVFNSFFLVASSHAETGYCCDGTTNVAATQDMCFFTWQAAPCAAEEATVPESKIIPSCLLGTTFSPGCDNINQFIILGINVGTYIFGFIGALALLFFVYGGFMMILSQGNQEKVKKGTSAMVAAVIGLVIAFGAYALITFLSRTIGVKTEKSLTFVETVYAVEDEPVLATCLEEGGCFCTQLWSATDEEEECGPIDFEQGCYGEIHSSCDDSATAVETPSAEILQEEIGASKEDGTAAPNVSELTKAALKLNKMDIGEPDVLFARAINAMMAFMGSIALILYIYAGFVWMSAGGAAERITKAKNILIWTTLGAVAMGAGYMIVRTVLERIG